jgi:sugar/nucleoside kinase (ribokinase family)
MTCATLQYLKPRDMTDPTLAGEHDRYDSQDRTPPTSGLQDRIVTALDGILPRVDAVILVDQVETVDCGTLTRRVREAVAERARRSPRVIFWADSRARIGLFRNVIIKPNQFEAAGLSGPPSGDEVDLATLQAGLARLRAAVGAPVVVTRGERGAIVTDPEPTEVPGVRLTGPVDPTGAGDSLAAGCVLALAAGATLPEAALVGCLVASITVQQLATCGTASRNELPARLQQWQSQREG